MKRVITPLVGLSLLVLVSHAQAEFRTILVRIKLGDNKKPSVTIYSDDAPDRRTATTVDDAAKAIRAMKGWGSSVGVYVTSDRAIRGDELKTLFGAIADNAWLELEFFGRDVPRHVGDHFLKKERAK